ncbi:MAG: ATP-binding protein, partial [Actinomycetota bacterium]|nr:ATP-binding protein [Actinomycetota bacterium]
MARGRRPSLPVYLGGLLLLFGLVTAALGGYQRSRNVERAEREAAEWVAFRAALGAREIDVAIELTMESVAAVAASPGLDALFTGEAANGCTLTFTGAGPFSGGHMDIIDAAGLARCSSRPLPSVIEFAGAAFLPPTQGSASVLGPVVDPVSGRDALVVVQAVGTGGVVAAFLELDGLEARLADSLSGPVPTTFAVGDGDGAAGAAGSGVIAAAAAISSIGFTVDASVQRAAALAEVDELNRTLLLGELLGLAALVAATLLLYRFVARPIERLGAAVRAGIDDDSADLRGGGPAEVVALAEDFTALRRTVAAELQGRRNAEAEARAAELRYRTLFATNPVPMWVHDVETRQLLDVNDAAVAGYGYSRDELLALTAEGLGIGQAAGAAGHGTDDDLARATRHARKDGRLVEVLTTMQAVEFGDHMAQLVMAEDVTEREQARRILERTQRMDSLGQLAGGIAHDFNNLLAVMLGFVDLALPALRTGAAEDPERWGRPLSDVEHVDAAGRRAGALTQQLLRFARGEHVQLGPVDLNDVLAGLEGLLLQTLGSPHELGLSLDDRLRQTIADAGQIEQVVLNLAVNAKDAMPHGGRLLIETANVDIEADDPRLASQPQLRPGPFVRLRVSDSGTGMGPAERDRAFEPFFTTKGRSTGTGLGLATVYGIVTSAGGAVYVYSEPGHGTTFT